MFQILINALRETIYMIFFASIFSMALGIPFGMLMMKLATTENKTIKAIFVVCNSTLQFAKYTPYLLIMLLFIPLTNWLIIHGISYTTATLLPLTTVGTLLLAQRVYRILLDLNGQWQGITKALGATQKQSLFLILLPEARTDLIKAATDTCVLVLGFSIIAGALGAGGLGQLAVEKSINEPDHLCMLLSIILLVVIQQLIAYTGHLVIQHTQPR